MSGEASRQITIQDPRRADAHAILDVACGSGVFSDQDIAVLGELLAEHFGHGADCSGYHFLIARNEHDLLGFACYGPRPLTRGTFDLYWLAVAPDALRRGVGTALVEQVAERLRRVRGRLLIAETSGLPAYRPAREFYDRHAFRVVATIADFYAPGDDLVLFVRRLE